MGTSDAIDMAETPLAVVVFAVGCLSDVDAAFVLILATLYKASSECQTRYPLPRLTSQLVRAGASRAVSFVTHHANLQRRGLPVLARL